MWGFAVELRDVAGDDGGDGGESDRDRDRDHDRPFGGGLWVCGC